MRLIGHGATDTGVTRDHNEDSFFADSELGLFAVCDGVGGAQGGEVASQMAVEKIVATYRAVGSDLAKVGKPGDQATVDLLLSGLSQGVVAASESIFNRSLLDRSLTGMSTTTVNLAVSGGRAILAHVGDSRIYMLRDEKLYQLTEDHSLMGELQRQGVLQEEDLKHFRYKNVIIRAVGQHPTVKVDTSIVEIQPNDVFLLCSDGLTDQVSDEIIAAVLSDHDPAKAVDKLITLSNKAGGKDNVTVVIVQAAGAASSVPALATEEKALALGRFFLFKDLTFPGLLRVLKVVQEIRLEAGHTVLRQGEVGDALYLVTSGALAVRRNDVQLNVLEDGQHFGELALISDQVRSATVQAIKPSVLLRIERDDFLQLLREDSVVATKLLWRFLQETSARIRALSQSYSDIVHDMASRPPIPLSDEPDGENALLGTAESPRLELTQVPGRQRRDELEISRAPTIAPLSREDD